MTAAARPTEAELDEVVGQLQRVPLYQVVGKRVPLADRAADAIAALRAERDALREALRKHWIQPEYGEYDGPHRTVWCIGCKHSWVWDSAEKHTPGCLAAPPKEKKE